MLDKDLLLLAQAIAPVVARQFKEALDPLAARIAKIEEGLATESPVLAELRRDLAEMGQKVEQKASDLAGGLASAVKSAVDALPAPKDGTSVTLADVLPMIKAGIQEAADVLPSTEEVRALIKSEVAALPPAPAGKDADPEVVKQLVAAAVEALPKPQDGKSVTAEELRPLVAEFVGAAMAEIPTPRDGKDVDPEVVKTMITDAVTAAVGALPSAKDGRDVDPEAVKTMVGDEVSRQVGGLPKPADGTSVTADDVRPMLETLVAEKVAALPAPKDGASITVDDARPLIEETVAKAVAELPPAKDGVGLAGAVIDREGNLVVTLTDGSTKELGRIDGEPGKDGLGFDDLDIVHDGGRGFTIRLVRGEHIKEFPFTLPIVLDAGVFKDGTEYQAGDGVSFGGSFWIAKAATKDRPGTSDAFRLAVKKGRDGKDSEAPQPPATVKLK